MRVVIAGSRELTDDHLVEEAVRLSGFTITTVISGAARGVDQLGERWAARHEVPVVRFPADWARYGRAAGLRRNQAMVEEVARAPEGGAVIAIWDGVSKGTRSTIEFARRCGVEVFVLRVPAPPR